MKVAVTGAAGFVGTNLLNLLVEQGHQVTAIDRVRSEYAPTAGVTWVEGNVLDPTSMEQALEGAEVVYHLVAMITLKQNDDLAWRLNTEGVRITAEAALKVGVRRFVHCSSIHSFDQYNCGGFIDETTSRSVDPSLPVYDRSKWAGEIELRKVIDAGLDAVICNPTGVYGPVDHGPSRINGMLRDSARGRVPAVIEGGFDFVDVRDVVAGLTAAAEKGRTGENYLLTGQMLSMLEAFRIAARVAGRRGPLYAFPMKIIEAILPVAEPIASAFGSDVVSRAAMGSLIASPVVSGDKARTEIGYTSRPAAETIRDLVSFFVESGQLSR
ncbi:NAD-dependent epimerase/dehydratase family protein [Rhodococcus sp. D2-41]|uniref:NAD-dependent epimerase/dehydratase family protein n=1 Tax=Speluncibacter jeojiensis TaxID=2710754 RepID=A0A9X4RGU8_9ACTN|nr:NAD-dependent epimerase/dehydratase family protein [Rhodococcus sp. D2-41]MDG3009657.1 NAD-dependent epimerase/dehydratase family protein [Rhodococcus sp. D2-41]MDG3014406.1 NAD-dependent epimerase/dehydratase family protein [Corynebacteriales bacterium D3-21]